MAKPKNVQPPTDIRSILILKSDHLGDLMLAAPAVHSLRVAFPDAKITLAGSKKGGELFRELGLVHTAISIPPISTAPLKLGSLARAIVRLRKIQYDLVVNLRHDFRDIWFATMLKGRYLCSYDHRGLGFLASHIGPAPLPDRYEAENHLAVIKTLGVEPRAWNVPDDIEPGDSFFEHPESQDKPWLVIHPVARTRAKNWPVERFAQVCANMTERGYFPICVGDEQDQSVCAKVLEQAGAGANLAGRLSFGRLFGLLKSAALFVGVDSFVMHAAAAVDLPGVAVFSGTNRAARWAPPNIEIVSASVDCAPCGLTDCDRFDHKCMENIPAEAVIQALLLTMEKVR
jgi:ADP-heptose:LPS heptosyltransferase